MPTLDPAEARARFAASPLARLATADARSRPHLVPVVFALDGDTLVTAVDHKPKRTTRLRRLANIAENPQVSLLVDGGYREDWEALWWARADGRARVVPAGGDPELRGRAVALLREKYPQYRRQPPEGPVVLVRVERWTGWTATRPGAD